MATTTIAHLSDLHLGNDLLWRSVRHLRWPTRKDDEKLIRGLSAILTELKPDYVIISGDIVNKSTARNFSTAASLVQGLFAGASIDIGKRVFVVPGNHDAPIRRISHEHFGRLREFSIFLKALFREDDFVSRKARFVRTDIESRLCIIGLDSTLKVGLASSQDGLAQIQRAEGEIGAPQREWFRDKMRRLSQAHAGFDRFVKVVVLHHHPEDIEGSAGTELFMQLLDKADVKTMFADAGVNIVLHGHKHHPHQKRVEHGRKGHYTVIGAGATLCTIPGETASHGNSFNLIRIMPEVNMLEVQLYKANTEKRFTADGAPRHEQLFHGPTAGYGMRTIEQTTKIVDMEGRCIDSNRRLGIFVDAPMQDLRQLSFRWGTESALAEIVEFEHDTEAIESIAVPRAGGMPATRGFGRVRSCCAERCSGANSRSTCGGASRPRVRSACGGPICLGSTRGCRLTKKAWSRRWCITPTSSFSRSSFHAGSGLRCMPNAWTRTARRSTWTRRQ